MKKKKTLIIGLSVVLLVVVILALFLLKNNKNNIITTEERYRDIANKVENYTFDEESGLLYVNNEIIVIANTRAAESDIKNLADRYDATISDAMPDIGVYRFSFHKEMSVAEIDSLCSSLKYESLVDDAYLNPVVDSETDTTEEEGMVPLRTEVYPDDGWNSASWNQFVPNNENWGVEAINAPTAWAYLDDLYDVNVGLIDTLPTTEHPDLDITVMVGNSNERLNYYSAEEREVSSWEADMHGCHVAGTIGAKWNNGTGVSGVVGSKGHMFYSSSTSGNLNFYSTYEYLRDIKTLVSNDVRAINISLGYGGILPIAASKGNENAINYIQSQADLAEPVLKRIIEDIEENGGNDFVICVSAGNSNNDVYYIDDSSVYGYVEKPEPGQSLESGVGGALTLYNSFLALIDDAAVRDRIIVVGAVGIDHTNSNEQETRYRYSDFSNVGSRVDVVAPGEEIYSLDTSGYVSLAGTSMAAPHVTGTAALAFAANPQLSGPEVKELIVSLTNGRYYFQDGYAGLVDAGKVTRAALSSRETGDINIVSNKTGLDLCFVVDTTGSMGPHIQNAKDNMVSILNELSAKSSAYRVAIVDYRDFSDRTGDSVDYPAKTRLKFSRNNSEIISAINDLNLGNGGDFAETGDRVRIKL